MPDKETEKKIGQLQLYEQSLQNILLQKQQFHAQMTEFDSALSQLQDSSENYLIIGNIMVKSGKEKIKKDLEEKKSSTEIRIKALEKQEMTIRTKVEKLQEEVMKNMDEKNDI